MKSFWGKSHIYIEIVTLSCLALPVINDPHLQERQTYFYLLIIWSAGRFLSYCTIKCVWYTNDSMYQNYLFLPKWLKLKLHLNKTINMKYVFIFIFIPKVLQFQLKTHFPQVLDYLPISQSNHYIIETCRFFELDISWYCVVS